MVVAQGTRRYRACWARTREQDAERRLGGTRGGLWEGAEHRGQSHLGGGVSWSCHLQAALSADKATAQTGMDKNEKGA